MCEDVSRIGKSVGPTSPTSRLARPDFNNDWGKICPEPTDSLFLGDLLAVSARVNHELGVLEGAVESSTLGPCVKEERKGRHFECGCWPTDTLWCARLKASAGTFAPPTTTVNGVDGCEDIA